MERLLESDFNEIGRSGNQNHTNVLGRIRVNMCGLVVSTGLDSSVCRVSAPGNGRSWVRSWAVTYQSH